MVAEELRCAVWHGRGDVRLESRPLPEPGPGDVLVRIAACGLCATDLHLIDGSIPLYQPPRVLGHEAAGVIRAVGPAVRSVRPGDAVALDTSVPCDVCFYCREARPFLCGDRRPVFGYLAMAYDPNGKHDFPTADRLFPCVLKWLAPRLEPYAPQ